MQAMHATHATHASNSASANAPPTSAGNQSFMTSASKLHHQNILRHEREWFDDFMYILLVVCFHIAFAVYLFFHYQVLVNDSTTIASSNMFILIYVLGYNLRRQERFLFVPNFLELLFKYVSSSISGSTRLYIHDPTPHPSWWPIARGLCMAFFEVPIIVTILWNTALFFLTANSCDSYFFCLYSWDHWFQGISIWSVAVYYYQEFFTCSFLDVIFMLFLILLGGGIIVLPFFILDQIAYYTILITLWYELLNVGVALHLLYIHYHRIVIQ